MKKFLIRILCYLLGFGLLLAGACVLIDPFNVLHPLSLRDNGVEPNKNYIKMTWLLHEPERFDALLFGSSRVGSIHAENIPGLRCYNMSYSGGLPEEHLTNLKTLVGAGIVPKRVFLGLDSVSYTEDPAEHYDQPIRMPYEIAKREPLLFWKTYLDPDMVRDAVFDVILKHHKTPGFAENFYAFGWDHDYGYVSAYDFTQAKPVIGPQMRIPETLETVAEIVRLCRDEGIELTVFTNPMYEVSYAAAVERDYLVFLRELAQITPYWNFSGYNAYTTDASRFFDASHYNAELGDILIERMCGDSTAASSGDGFGMYVTPENADELIGILQAQLHAD